FQNQSLEPVEVHRNLSTDPANRRYFRGLLAANSKRLCGDGPDVVLQPPVGEAMLAGGRDPGGIDLRWYTGYDDGQYFTPAAIPGGKTCGLAALENEPEIDLVSIPDLAGQTLLPAGGAESTAQDELYLQAYRQVLYHAAKCGDRVALIDTREGIPPDTVVSI